jgi:hypothetical protein
MKRVVLFLLVLGIGIPLFAQGQLQLPEHHFASGSGSWSLAGTRLFQTAVDRNARLAKVNFQIPQSGPMIYEFNVRYEDVVDKTHAGFGLHIFANNVIHRASWGSGTSYLLWLNYDENPITPGIPRGFSAQVYRSRTNSVMELVESIDLNQYADLLTWENLSQPIPFRIWANGDTGEVRVYDPSDPDMQSYYYFHIDRRDLPLRGNWISLRVNGARLSFGMGLE